MPNIGPALRNAILAGSIAPIPSSNSSPLNYIGGKAKVADQLWRLRPDDSTYTTIVDPFGGAASVPLTYSKLNGGIKKHVKIRDMFFPTINFWVVLRDSTWEMAGRANALLSTYRDGEELFKACVDIINNAMATGNDKVGAAAAYYIHTHTCVPAKQFYIDKSSYSPTKTGRWLGTAKGNVGRLMRLMPLTH